jgi:serine/threonine-protein kinase
VRERVRLFGQVCGAVQHAHQKGVIHRDLKPSNVLVTEVDGQPQVKVIDFGIAKAVAPTADSARLTATGLSVGTPAYMSPEQFAGAGGDVDTRSDIYALGVLLYELLTGALPFDVVGWALVARHASGEVPTPSARYAGLSEVARAERAQARRTEAGALRVALQGDLDAVLLKALEHDRERRYATAGDLARDLAHYLRDEPVAATRATGAYRLRKFVRRHRAAVSFAAAVAALVVAFAATWAAQARRLARAERVAVARQAQAEDLVGFMLGDLRERLTPLGRLDVLDAVGEKALAYFAAVPEAELSSGELYRRSRALEQLGQVRVDQGRLPEASALFRQAVDVGERLTARDPANPQWQIALGRAHFWAGSIEWRQGNPDAALAEFVPMVRISERLIARFPDSTAFRRELAYALGNIGSAREAQGNLAGALRAYEQALALRRAPPLAAAPGARADLAIDYNALGVAQRKAGRLADAVATHRAELALRQALLAADSGDRALQRGAANAHVFLGYARLAAGDADGALSDARSARPALAALVARDSGNAAWRTDLAVLDNLVAQQLVDRGDAAAALRAADAAEAQLRPLAARPAPTQRVLRTLAMARTTRARALLGLGRPADALAGVRAAADTAGATLARRPADLDHRRVLGDAYLALGDILSAAGDRAGAAAARARALAAVDSAARATGQTELLAIQAAALLDLGRLDDARPVTAELRRRGYGHPGYVARLRRLGLDAAS